MRARIFRLSFFWEPFPRFLFAPCLSSDCWTACARVPCVYLACTVHVPCGGRSCFPLFIFPFFFCCAWMWAWIWMLHAPCSASSMSLCSNFVHPFVSSGDQPAHLWHVPALDDVVQFCDWWRVPYDVCLMTCALWRVPYDVFLMTCSLWHVPYDMWLMTCDLWHVPYDMWLMTCDLWHVPALDDVVQFCEMSLPLSRCLWLSCVSLSCCN
jgi:hypothetical protein